ANFRLGGESDHPPRPNPPIARSGDGARETVDHYINVTDRRGMSASQPTQRSTGKVVKVARGLTPAVPLQSRERQVSAHCRPPRTTASSTAVRRKLPFRGRCPEPGVTKK